MTETKKKSGVQLSVELANEAMLAMGKFADDDLTFAKMSVADQAATMSLAAQILVENIFAKLAVALEPGKEEQILERWITHFKLHSFSDECMQIALKNARLMQERVH